MQLCTRDKYVCFWKYFAAMCVIGVRHVNMAGLCVRLVVSNLLEQTFYLHKQFATYHESLPSPHFQATYKASTKISNP